MRAFQVSTTSDLACALSRIGAVATATIPDRRVCFPSNFSPMSWFAKLSDMYGVSLVQISILVSEWLAQSQAVVDTIDVA